MAGARLTVEFGPAAQPARSTTRKARPVRRGARMLEEYERATTEHDRFLLMQRWIRSLSVALRRRNPEAADRLVREAHHGLHRIGRAMADELGRPRPGASR